MDAQDLRGCGIRAVQMNVYHLLQRPGSTTIQALGGLHRMSGWDGPIFTDSGGFQVYSLIRQKPKSGSITDRGATFHIEGSERRFNLTPEKSIQLQLSYGSDVVICLDDCTHMDDPFTTQQESSAAHGEMGQTMPGCLPTRGGEKVRGKVAGRVSSPSFRVATARNCANNVPNNCWRLALMGMVMGAGLWITRGIY